jgi:hypothetical protein
MEEENKRSCPHFWMNSVPLFDELKINLLFS